MIAVRCGGSFHVCIGQTISKLICFRIFVRRNTETEHSKMPFQLVGVRLKIIPYDSVRAIAMQSTLITREVFLS